MKYQDLEQMGSLPIEHQLEHLRREAIHVRDFVAMQRVALANDVISIF